MNNKSVWIIVFLVGGYILCQAIADVGATKLITVAGIAMPAGSLIFAFTFTLRDLLHKRLGKEWARAAIVAAACFNIFQALYLALMARLPSPPFFQYGEAWASIFAVVPAITLGSIIAEVVSELTDTEIYSLWKSKFPKAPQWSRVLVSNAVSLPVDSLVFAMLAFVFLPPLFGAEPLPVYAALSLVVGQIVFKAIITLVSMPLIYTVKDEKLVLDFSSAPAD